MEEDFKNKKKDILKNDNSIVDIEIMGVFGNRWGGKPENQEMMLRIVYKGEKRIIKTVKFHNWYDDLTTTIYETRKYFRTHKLERILDGD
jgi:hypothetical protein